MKVQIRWNPDTRAWHFGQWDLEGNAVMLSNQRATYPEAMRDVSSAGHEVDNAGWKHKVLSWNWDMHSLDGFPEWQIEKDRCPAFVKLTHVRGTGSVESSALAEAWDDIAEVDFYQRDWTDSGIPFVDKGEIYWSGWWFATLAERDRFVVWATARTDAGDKAEGSGK